MAQERLLNTVSIFLVYEACQPSSHSMLIDSRYRHDEMHLLRFLSGSLPG